MDFVQTFSHQRSVLTNLGGKLVYSESISVTFMHEKQNPYKKAGCKIFTNSYKNINMNKLISSTCLYCSSVHPDVLMHPEEQIQSGQNRGHFLLYVTVLRYFNRVMQISPALRPHSLSVPSESAKYTRNDRNCFVTIKIRQQIMVEHSGGENNTLFSLLRLGSRAASHQTHGCGLIAGWQGWWWARSELGSGQEGGRLSTANRQKHRHHRVLTDGGRRGTWRMRLSPCDLRWWGYAPGGCRQRCGPAAAAGRSSGASELLRGRP